MRKAYYYLFYRIYRVVDKSSKAMGGAFLTDFKAVCLLIILEIYLLFSIGIYVVEFERWPKRKNVIGGWIVVSLMSLLVVNFVFTFYLLSH